MTPLVQLLAASGSLLLLFAGVFVLARRLDNYSIVDVAWSLAFGPVALFFAATGPGWAPRRWVLAAMVVAWSTRLGLHLWSRVAAHHPTEDGRYVGMRESWRGRLGPMMFGFFQLQAVSVALLSLPFLMPAHNPEPRIHILEILGAVLWFAALCGEAVADAQLRAFKRDPASRGQVCDTGLWRYSRHPNYFFEWLVWVGFAVMACASPWGCLGLLSPLVILLLLLHVTGVPPTEAQALRSRGAAYRRYQETTSPFFPWPPRAATTPPVQSNTHPTP